MSISKHLSVSVRSGDRTESGSSTFTNGAGKSISEPVPAASTNLSIVVGLNISKTKLLYMKSNYDMTLKVNSSGAPEATHVLSGGVPFIWHEDMGFPMQLGVDQADEVLTNDTITNLFLTGDANNDDTFVLEAVYDPT